MSLREPSRTRNRSRFAQVEGRAQSNCRGAISCGLLLFTLLWAGCVWPQSETTNLNTMEEEYVTPLLKYQILSLAVAEFQVRQYLLNQVAAPPQVPSTPQEWTAEAARLRRHLIDDVAFHGWPKEWVDSAPRFEEIGVIETGGGYRIRKLRYEIVPGFYSTALLYEPQHPSGKMPAILHVHGHVGAMGKAIEFKQKRCINYAKHGVVALSLDWFLHGELNEKGNDHWLGAQLDLAGANVLGIFYLEMRRGLDYLYNDPNVDRTRIGVTGLSGGGWQTIVLSSLDERVKAANPVAGFSSLRSKIEANGDRTIGIEAAQLIGVARWAEKCSGAAKVRLETGGIRTQAIGLVAAALEPGLFSEISVRNGMHSLSYVFNLPVEFEQAPELFCLDLYKEFDIDSLEALAGPATVRVAHYRELP